MATVSVPVAAASYKDPVRVLTSILAPVEKRVLLWLAWRLPARVNADHLTCLALAAMLGAGASYWWASRTPLGLLLAVVCLAINWFGDSLDGTVARVRHQQRPRYGFYVDHVVDEFGAAFLLGGLALSGYMSPSVAVAVLIVYFMLCVEVFLATHVLGSFRMSFFKIGPTELRVLLAVGSLFVLIHPRTSIFGREYLLFDVGGVVAAAGLGVTLMISAIANTRHLYRAEPMPARTPS